MLAAGQHEAMAATASTDGANDMASTYTTPVPTMIRLGLEAWVWDSRAHRYNGTRPVVHLVTDLNDDGMTLCGKSVGHLVALKGTARVLDHEAPASRPWSTATCWYCQEVVATAARQALYRENMARERAAATCSTCDYLGPDRQPPMKATRKIAGTWYCEAHGMDIYCD